MKVFLLTMGQDTAGNSIRIREGFSRLSPRDTVRVMTSTQTYLGYPRDLPFSRRKAEQLWRDADVVHLHNTMAGWTMFGRRDRKPKPMVLHHHGTAFRDDHARISRVARQLRVVEVASTVDLLKYEPGLRWLPSPFNLQMLRAIREAEYVPSERIRIIHAPTNREIKSTDAVIAAVERLSTKYPIDFDLIEKVGWRECLARKARGDIFVDQVRLGYGCNTIEAWAMGLPVVAGTDDPWTRDKMIEMWGELPFVPATEASMVDVIEMLIVDHAARQAAIDRGVGHVERYHAEEQVVRLLRDDIYARAIGR